MREDYSKEFDFDSMNEQFDKEKEMAKLSLSASKASTADDGEEGDQEAENEPTKAYSKSSFFDSISCDITDRQEGNSRRSSNSDERQRNRETFGATGVNTRYRRRGNYQHNYRGGRGGRRYNGRGSRGRGGRYNNSYSSDNRPPRTEPAENPVSQ